MGGLLILVAFPVEKHGLEVGGGFRMGNMCTPVVDAC